MSNQNWQDNNQGQSIGQSYNGSHPVGQGNGNQDYNSGAQQSAGQSWNAGQGYSGAGNGTYAGSPQSYNNPGQPSFNQPQNSPAGSDGVGAVFGDLQFRRSLTEKIAGPTFLAICAATALWFLFDVIYGFVGDSWSSGGSDGNVSMKMGVFPAILNLLADIAIAGAVILAARVLLELAINVARNSRR